MCLYGVSPTSFYCKKKMWEGKKFFEEHTVQAPVLGLQMKTQVPQMPRKH